MQRVEIDGVRTNDKLPFDGTLPLPQKKRVSLGDVQWVIGHYKNGRFIIVYQTDIFHNLGYLVKMHKQDYPNYVCFCFKLTCEIQRV